VALYVVLGVAVTLGTLVFFNPFPPFYRRLRTDRCEVSPFIFWGCPPALRTQVLSEACAALLNGTFIACLVLSLRYEHGVQEPIGSPLWDVAKAARVLTLSYVPFKTSFHMALAVPVLGMLAGWICKVRGQNFADELNRPLAILFIEGCSILVFRALGAASVCGKIKPADSAQQLVVDENIECNKPLQVYMSVAGMLGICTMYGLMVLLCHRKCGKEGEAAVHFMPLVFFHVQTRTCLAVLSSMLGTYHPVALCVSCAVCALAELIMVGKGEACRYALVDMIRLALAAFTTFAAYCVGMANLGDSRDLLNLANSVFLLGTGFAALLAALVAIRMWCSAGRKPSIQPLPVQVRDSISSGMSLAAIPSEYPGVLAPEQRGALGVGSSSPGPRPPPAGTQR